MKSTTGLILCVAALAQLVDVKKRNERGLGDCRE